eukprot:UN01124
MDRQHNQSRRMLLWIITSFPELPRYPNKLLEYKESAPWRSVRSRCLPLHAVCDTVNSAFSVQKSALKR